MSTLASIADTMESKIANIDVKTCTDCNISKRTTAFYGLERGIKSVSPYCKDCHKQRNKLARRKRDCSSESVAKIADTMEGKTAPLTLIECADCNLTKPSTDFSLNQKNSRSVRPYCKVCHTRRNKLSHQKHSLMHSKPKPSERLKTMSGLMAFEKCLQVAHAS